MLGDVLKRRINELSNASTNKKDGKTAFWVILRDIAREEIIKLNEPVDSDIIIPIYYEILCENINKIPKYFKKKLPINKQYRFRVINRNVFSSNAFHADGLANQPNIKARKEVNQNKKGYRIIFEGE